MFYFSLFWDYTHTQNMHHAWCKVFRQDISPIASLGGTFYSEHTIWFKRIFFCQRRENIGFFYKPLFFFLLSQYYVYTRTLLLPNAFVMAGFSTGLSKEFLLWLRWIKCATTLTKRCNRRGTRRRKVVSWTHNNGSLHTNTYIFGGKGNRIDRKGVDLSCSLFFENKIKE